VVFHVSVASIAYFGLPVLRRDFNPFTEAVPVEFISIDDVNRVSQPVPEPEPAATIEARAVQPPPQQVQPRPQVSDAVPLPEAAPPDNPSPTPPQPQIQRRSIPQNISVRAKPRPPSAINMGRLAALIDRSVDDQQARQAIEDEEQQAEQNLIEEAVRSAQLSAIEARVATATLEGAIRQMVEACWNVPAGAKDAEDLLVRLRIRLRPDGSLARPPEFLDRGRMSDPFYRVAAESAARAVRQCAPYDLPPDQYELWRDLTFNFDPKEMLDG
jgi:hypothetical protein